MTLEEAISDALDFLNLPASEQERRFERTLGDGANVRQAVELAWAYAEALRAGDWQPYDRQHHEGTIERLSELRDRVVPSYRTQLEARWHEARARYQVGQRTQHVGEPSPVYTAIMYDLSVGGGSSSGSIWSVLDQALRRWQGEAPGVGRCRHCGRLFLRGRADQRYCGNACRARASEGRVTAEGN